MEKKYYYFLLVLFILVVCSVNYFRPHAVGVDSYYFSNAVQGFRSFNEQTPQLSKTFFSFFANDLKLVGVIIQALIILSLFLVFKFFSNNQIALFATLFIFFNPFTLTQLIEFEDDLLGYIILIPAIALFYYGINYGKKSLESFGKPFFGVIGGLLLMLLACFFWEGALIYTIISCFILFIYVFSGFKEFNQKVVWLIGLIFGLLTMNFNVIENLPFLAVLATFPLVLILLKNKLFTIEDIKGNVALSFWFLGALNSKFAFFGIILITIFFVQQFGKKLFDSVKLKNELLVFVGLTIMIIISINSLAPTSNDFDVLNQAKLMNVKNNSWSVGYWYESIGVKPNHFGSFDGMDWNGLVVAQKSEFSDHLNCKLLNLNKQSLLDVGDCS